MAALDQLTLAKPGIVIIKSTGHPNYFLAQKCQPSLAQLVERLIRNFGIYVYAIDSRVGQAFHSFGILGVLAGN
jgi:hypothetical protein